MIFHMVYKIWTDLSTVLSQFTRLTDRGQTEFSSLDRVCIACSAVKMTHRKMTEE